MQSIFESRFGARFGGAENYSIKTMGLEPYVRDRRFYAHGAAVSIDNAPDRWVTHRDLPAFFASLDPAKTAMLCHNAQFDGFVASHHYGFHAAAYICTMQMARMLALPGSLAGLALHFRLPPKGKDLKLSSGLEFLPEWVEPRIAAYSCHDNWLCREIFKRLRSMLPAAELALVSGVSKMFTRPLFELDPEPLRARILEIEAKRLGLQQEAGLSRDQLMSDIQLSQFLASEGVIRPVGKGQYAKSNPDFLALAEHPNDRVALAVSARLGVKGTMEQTRAQTFLNMWERGPLPVFLNCGGAGTTRLSGGDGTNFQNLKRGSVIRSALHAPEGYEVVVSDSKQIEARVLDFLAQQHDALDLWRAGADQYRILAAKFYPGLEITKDLRNVGKVVMLAGGYGMGAETLQRQLAAGLMGNPPLHIDMQTAEAWKTALRNQKPMWVKLWYRANDWIEDMAAGRQVDYMMLKIRSGRIELPNGLILRYPDLSQDSEGWTYRTQHGGRAHLWGGTVVQNVCEALARDVVVPQCVAIERELPWLSMTHDEGAFLAPAAEAAARAVWAEEVMRVLKPDWARECPIDAEATASRGYDK